MQLSDFSLVGGGLLHRIWRRTGLTGDALEWTHRRVLAMVLITWLPLLLLSIVEGNAWGGSGTVAFLQDIDTQLRLLIAAPLLLLAENRIHRVMPRIVQIFLDRGLIPDAARGRFEAAIASALRLRNSFVAEILLIVFVYSVALPFVWRDQLALSVTSWYATAEGGRLHPTLAGWWAGLVSMALFQFLVLRWFFRFFIWARFLWQVSRIPLILEPAHPDGTAGLHFLARSGRACNVVLLGLGTVLAGTIANAIFYEGARLLDFKVEIVGTAGLLTFLVLGPLLVFTPQLWAARTRGMEEYGALGQQYAKQFQRKWMRGGDPASEPLLGSADIQSLADLRNGYQVIEGMRLAPFSIKNAISLAVTTALPVAPLLLTTFSVEQLLDSVLKTLL